MESILKKEIINFLKKIFTKLYIVKLRKQLIEIPTIYQYDLICT